MTPETPSPTNEAPPGYQDFGDVVELVRGLGDSAVNEFLEGLAPYLPGVQRREQVAVEGLAVFLQRCALSAALITQAGGVESMQQAGRIAAKAPAYTREESIAKLSQLAS